MPPLRQPSRWAPLREFVPEDGWGMQEARVTVSDEPYHLVLLQATSTTGTTATAAIAFAACHPATLGSRAAPVGDWVATPSPHRSAAKLAFRSPVNRPSTSPKNCLGERQRGE